MYSQSVQWFELEGFPSNQTLKFQSFWFKQSSIRTHLIMYHLEKKGLRLTSSLSFQTMFRVIQKNHVCRNLVSNNCIKSGTNWYELLLWCSWFLPFLGPNSSKVKWRNTNFCTYILQGYPHIMILFALSLAVASGWCIGVTKTSSHSPPLVLQILAHFDPEIVVSNCYIWLFLK